MACPGAQSGGWVAKASTDASQSVSGTTGTVIRPAVWVRRCRTNSRSSASSGHTDATGSSRPIRSRSTSVSRHAPVTGLTADHVHSSDSSDRLSVHTSTTRRPPTKAATATPGPQPATASPTAS